MAFYECKKCGKVMEVYDDAKFITCDGCFTTQPVNENGEVKQEEAANASVNTQAFIERAFLFLEDGEWEKADEYSEKVLDVEPKNAQAYLVKLMSDLKVRKREYLKDYPNHFVVNNNYQKILRFGDEAIIMEMKEAVDSIEERFQQQRAAAENYRIQQEELRLQQEREAAELRAQQAKAAEEYRQQQAKIAEEMRIQREKEAQEMRIKQEEERKISTYRNMLAVNPYDFAVNGNVEFMKNCINNLISLGDYEEAPKLIEKFKEVLYDRASQLRNYDSKEDKEYAKEVFEYLGDYKDSKIFLEEYQQKLNQENQEKLQMKAFKKATFKKKLKKAVIAIVSIVVVLAIAAVSLVVVFPIMKYNKALELLDEKKYAEAIEELDLIRGYKDSISLIRQARKDKAMVDSYNFAANIEKEGYKMQAAMAYGAAGDYEDAQEKSKELWDSFLKRKTFDAYFDVVAIKTGGTVYAESEYSEVNSWKGIVEVSAGEDFVVGLQDDGKVLLAGTSSFYETVDEFDYLDDVKDVEDWENIVSISANSTFVAGLKSDGTIVATGYRNDYLTGANNIVAIDTGYGHIVGLKPDGTVVAYGNNDNGQCNVKGWTDIVAISAGEYHTVGLRKDGTLVSTEFIDNPDSDYDSYSGQCDVREAGWKDIVAVAAGDTYTIAVKSDGRVLVTSGYGYVEETESWRKIIGVAAGQSYALALDDDGCLIYGSTNNYASQIRKP
ncbi:MAG: hypothetical protein E7536_03305 [Ruminococcaceae bacterium]|nr:hypothetical protein [Oscillospiraceae bacterium]